MNEIKTPDYKAVSLHISPASTAVDITDGSERGEYVNQDYILRQLGRPHRHVNLMYCYYPNDEGWPQRAHDAHAHECAPVLLDKFPSLLKHLYSQLFPVHRDSSLYNSENIPLLPILEWMSQKKCHKPASCRLVAFSGTLADLSALHVLPSFYSNQIIIIT